MKELKNKNKTSKKRQKGITLIALVITIVVLLILAGVSIAMLTGENGILTQATRAKEQTEIAEAKEQAQLDIAVWRADKLQKNEDDTLTNDIIKSILADKDYVGTLGDSSFTTAKGGYEIPYSELYSASTGGGESIATNTEYVGYYADLNNDGKITLADDGIIYADLAVGGNGTWNNDSWSSYSYDAVASGLNEYVIKSETSEVDPLKTGKGIIQLSQENETDRFYVMALEDVNSGTSYCWYDAAYGKLDKTVATGYNDFGEGRTNSEYVMAKWDDTDLPWGAHDAHSTYQDLWGVIKDKYEKGWFVPSKAEWSAFGDYLYKNCELTTSDYSTYGLSAIYWSPTQYRTDSAFLARFDRGLIYASNVRGHECVRLSATF